MFQLDTFPFPVEIKDNVSPDVDDLFIDFYFKQPVRKLNREQLEEILAFWGESVIDTGLINYVETEPEWRNKNRKAEIFIDTGGNDPTLTPHLNTLLRQIAEVGELAKVKISSG